MITLKVTDKMHAWVEAQIKKGFYNKRDIVQTMLWRRSE